jgi:hypothetical protein
MPGLKPFGIEDAGEGARIPHLRCDNASMVPRPGETSMAARRVQRHEAMDARVRLSSREQLSDHPGRRCIMKARGWTTALLLRHETGHCNGWPSDHPGQRSLLDRLLLLRQQLHQSANASAGSATPRFKAPNRPVKPLSEMSWLARCRSARIVRPAEDRQRDRTEGAKAACEWCRYVEGG